MKKATLLRPTTVVKTMRTAPAQRTFVLVSLAGMALLSAAVASCSEGLYHFDDATRFLLARYWPYHPTLLTDTLNRPVYMVLATPLAQFRFTVPLS